MTEHKLWALVEGFGPISAAELAFHSDQKESYCTEYVEFLTKSNVLMLHSNFPKRYKVNPYFACYRSDYQFLSYAEWRKSVHCRTNKATLKA